METLSISLGFSIGGLKRITAAGWRIAECGWWLVAAAVIKGGAAHNRHKSPRLAALASPFFCACRSRFKLARASARRTKKPQACAWGFCWVGGPKRIRTAVAAFAELSLATRPSDQNFRRVALGLQIYENERGRLHLNRGKCTFAA
jgi:hypothetical protein